MFRNFAQTGSLAGPVPKSLCCCQTHTVQRSRWFSRFRNQSETRADPQPASPCAGEPHHPQGPPRSGSAAVLPAAEDIWPLTERRGKRECGSAKSECALTIWFPLKPQKRSPAGAPSCPPDTVRTRRAQTAAAELSSQGSAVYSCSGGQNLLPPPAGTRVISGKHTLGVRARQCVTDRLLLSS